MNVGARCQGTCLEYKYFEGAIVIVAEGSGPHGGITWQTILKHTFTVYFKKLFTTAKDVDR